jgi:magnesium chelatase subunit D
VIDAPVAAETWPDATLAAALFAVDPVGVGGIGLRAPAGPVRDQWLALLQQLAAGLPWRRLPLNIRDERLLGGLDLGATLQAGRPVGQRGLLAETDGGVLLAAMAERMSPEVAARLSAVLDRGEAVVERDGITQRHAARLGVVALDEGLGDDEKLPAALQERLAMLIDLHAVSPAEAFEVQAVIPELQADVAAARALLPGVTISDPVLQALCAAGVALGASSLRLALLAMRVARIHAALDGRHEADADDATVAVRLVLLPRATQLPAVESSEPPPDEAESQAPDEAPPEPPPAADDPADPDSETDSDTDAPLPEGALDDLVLQAALASLPAGLLTSLQARQQAADRSRSVGRSGAVRKSGRRGRPSGVRRGEPRGGERLNVIDTLRAAAPWQRLRGRVLEAGTLGRIQVRQEDFHVTRYRPKRETTTIFVVDASGSSALNRLAEAKGAVELLLADCYVRRDKVAVLGFRGRDAELLLPPTRSLVRAKRSLSGLPGGGGTPLAAAIDAAAALADAVARRGDTPLVVLLTDGRANVALDGRGGRAQAEADAMAAATRLRLGGPAVLLIDTSPRPQPQAARLAQAMLARYLPLPQAGAATMSAAVQAATRRR